MYLTPLIADNLQIKFNIVFPEVDNLPLHCSSKCIKMHRITYYIFKNYLSIFWGNTPDPVCRRLHSVPRHLGMVGKNGEKRDETGKEDG